MNYADAIQTWVRSLVNGTLGGSFEDELKDIVAEDIQNALELSIITRILSELPPQAFDEFETLLSGSADDATTHDGTATLIKQYIPNLDQLVTEEANEVQKSFMQM